MTTLTGNKMKHLDHTNMFDSFMNLDNESPRTLTTTAHNTDIHPYIDPLPTNSQMDGLLPFPLDNNNKYTCPWEEDASIFQLYNRAKNNLAHVQRILNLTWRIYKVKTKYPSFNLSSASSQRDTDSFQVEESFLFKDSSNNNNDTLVPSTIDFKFDSNNGFDNSEYFNLSTNNNNNHDNNNDTHIEIIKPTEKTGNVFIDNDNLISKDNEFDLDLNNNYLINNTHDKDMVMDSEDITPSPMAIPHSLPHSSLLNQNSFTNNNTSSSLLNSHQPSNHINHYDQQRVSSSFVFNYMTPSSSFSNHPSSSFSNRPSSSFSNHPSSSFSNHPYSSFSNHTSHNTLSYDTSTFAPSPAVPITSTTTIFNDSNSNSNNISFSLPNNKSTTHKSNTNTSSTTTNTSSTTTNTSGTTTNTSGTTTNTSGTTTNTSNLTTTLKKRSPSLTTKNRTQQQPTTIRCSNCQTHNTPLWRKDPQGNSLCNACGLFLKLHGVMRPLSLKTDTIKKRQRNNQANSNNNQTNTPRKNYNVKKVGSKEKINLDWLNLNM